MGWVGNLGAPHLHELREFRSLPPVVIPPVAFASVSASFDIVRKLGYVAHVVGNTLLSNK